MLAPCDAHAVCPCDARAVCPCDAPRCGRGGLAGREEALLAGLLEHGVLARAQRGDRGEVASGGVAPTTLVPRRPTPRWAGSSIDTACSYLARADTAAA